MDKNAKFRLLEKELKTSQDLLRQLRSGMVRSNHLCKELGGIGTSVFKFSINGYCDKLEELIRHIEQESRAK